MKRSVAGVTGAGTAAVVARSVMARAPGQERALATALKMPSGEVAFRGELVMVRRWRRIPSAMASAWQRSMPAASSSREPAWGTRARSGKARIRGTVASERSAVGSGRYRRDTALAVLSNALRGLLDEAHRETLGAGSGLKARGLPVRVCATVRHAPASAFCSPVAGVSPWNAIYYDIDGGPRSDVQDVMEKLLEHHRQRCRELHGL